MYRVLFEFQEVLFKCFSFRRVSSLNEIIFYAWWVTQDEVHELEVHGRLVVILDAQDGIFCESFPFKHFGINLKETDLVL